MKQDITIDDLNQLEYTSCVLKEALRKWPPAAQMARNMDHAVVIGGHLIPKGSLVIISPLANGRNPKNFPNPMQFIPERFLKDSKESKENK